MAVLRSKGMGAIRDVAEGLARCCLQIGRLDEAKRWATKLVTKIVFAFAFVQIIFKGSHLLISNLRMR